MRLASFVAALAISAAWLGGGCGDTSPPPKLVGFTFRAIGQGSVASFGWSGLLLHNVKILTGTTFSVGLTTPTDDCVTKPCSFQGPVSFDRIVTATNVDHRRCLHKMATKCENDEKCGPGDQCVFIFDTPTGTPLSASQDGSKVGACGWTFIPLKDLDGAPALKGSFDYGTGNLAFERLSVFLGLNGVGLYNGACLRCVGDKHPNDGNQDGTCMRGDPGPTGNIVYDLSSEGAKCDVNAFGSIPGFDASYSMDCAPAVPAQLPPIPFGAENSSSNPYREEITATSPRCTDPQIAGQHCLCGVCPPPPDFKPGDILKPCSSDAQCGGAPCGYLPANCNPNPPPLKEDAMTPNSDFISGPGAPAIGQCRNQLGPKDANVIATRPNWCVNRKCNWDPATGTGSCPSLLAPNGPPISCLPGGATTEVISSTANQPTPLGSSWIVDTAGTICTTHSGVPLIDAQLGIPGPIFSRRRFEITPEYKP